VCGKLHGGSHEHLPVTVKEVLEPAHDTRVELGKDVVEQQHARLAKLAFEVGELGQLEEYGKEPPLAL